MGVAVPEWLEEDRAEERVELCLIIFRGGADSERLEVSILLSVLVVGDLLCALDVLLLILACSRISSASGPISSASGAASCIRGSRCPGRVGAGLVK